MSVLVAPKSSVNFITRPSSLFISARADVMSLFTLTETLSNLAWLEKWDRVSSTDFNRNSKLWNEIKAYTGGTAIIGT